MFASKMMKWAGAGLFSVAVVPAISLAHVHNTKLTAIPAVTTAAPVKTAAIGSKKVVKTAAIKHKTAKLATKSHKATKLTATKHTASKLHTTKRSVSTLHAKSATKGGATKLAAKKKLTPVSM